MPSPFPGMDPYVEERSIWPDMHIRLIYNIAEALQAQVRPKYIARIGERVELAGMNKDYIPDVMVVEPPSEVATVQTAPPGTLVADEPQTIAFLEEERHVPYIEIIYRDTGDVVTQIEVLSPVNKIGAGREKYTQKQDSLLNSQVNLVEIDLISGPTSTFARAFEINSPYDWRYIVTISRPHQRHKLEFYAIPLRERLPVCRIPLRRADSDVLLDLPSIFSRSYDVGGYDLLLDYSKSPPVSLDKAEQEWIETLLAEKKLR